MRTYCGEKCGREEGNEGGKLSDKIPRYDTKSFLVFKALHALMTTSIFCPPNIDPPTQLLDHAKDVFNSPMSTDQSDLEIHICYKV